MYIGFCLVKYIQIYLFSHLFMIQRAVCVRHYKAVSCITFWQFIIHRHQIPLIIFFILAFRAGCIPHLKEHHGKTFYCISLDHDCRIFPVTETFFSINILICQIDSASKSRMSIDYSDFSVIPVILVSRKYWFNR